MAGLAFAGDAPSWFPARGGIGFLICGAAAFSPVGPGGRIGRRGKSLASTLTDSPIHAITASPPAALLALIGQSHSLSGGHG